MLIGRLLLFSLLSIACGQEYRNFQVKTPLTVKNPTDLPKSCVVTVLDEYPFSGHTAPMVHLPPPKCGSSNNWSHISINLTVSVNGTQYDRLGYVYMDGVEMWRFCTSEPGKKNVTWTTLKDVTRYRYLFQKGGLIKVAIANIHTPIYDGVFLTTATVTFHPEVPGTEVTTPNQILPIIYNGQPGNTNLLKIPRNVDSAFVELFASGNSQEEFWYQNVASPFYERLNPDYVIGKGPFRELQLYIDGKLAGTAFPYPVIFSGGIVPSLWRPSASYGTYEQPTYYIDVSTFLPLLCDNQKHNFSIYVSGMGAGHSINANWFVSGNLQLTLSPCEGNTTGRMTSYQVGDVFLEPTVTGTISDDNQTANIHITAERNIDISTLLLTCSGKKSVRYRQELLYSNTMNLTAGGMNSVVQHNAWGTVRSSHGGSSEKLLQDFTFPLFVNSTFFGPDPTDGTIAAQVNRSVNNQFLDPHTKTRSWTIVTQNASGTFVLKKNLGVSSIGNQSLLFIYFDTDGKGYSRKIEVVDQVVDTDLEAGNLVGFPSGFSPREVDPKNK